MSRVDQAFRRASYGPSAGEGQCPAAMAVPVVQGSSLDQYPPERRSPEAIVPGEPGPSIGRTTPPAGRDGRDAARVTAIARIRAENVQTPGVSHEAYNDLARAVNQLQAARGVNALMVSSALPGEGKTFTVANLAFVLSEQHKKKVLLIDADLLHPSIHELLDLPTSTGLGEALQTPGARLSLVDVSPHLAILPAGNADIDPVTALVSQSMRNLMLEVASRFDWVLLDTPPVSLLPEAHLLAWMTDGAVLVIRAGVTPYEQVQRAIDDLGVERVIGTVLNRATGRR